jgi:hypothetical protein
MITGNPIGAIDLYGTCKMLEHQDAPKNMTDEQWHEYKSRLIAWCMCKEGTFVYANEFAKKTDELYKEITSVYPNG